MATRHSGGAVARCQELNYIAAAAAAASGRRRREGTSAAPAAAAAPAGDRMHAHTRPSATRLWWQPLPFYVCRPPATVAVAPVATDAATEPVRRGARGGLALRDRHGASGLRLGRARCSWSRSGDSDAGARHCSDTRRRRLPLFTPPGASDPRPRCPGHAIDHDGIRWSGSSSAVTVQVTELQQCGSRVTVTESGWPVSRR